MKHLKTFYEINENFKDIKEEWLEISDDLNPNRQEFIDFFIKRGYSKYDIEKAHISLYNDSSKMKQDIKKSLNNTFDDRNSAININFRY